MTIDIPGDTLLQQVGGSNIYIDKFMPLSLSAKSCVNEKMRAILEVLKTQSSISDNHKIVLEHMIDACKCKTYKHVAFRSWLNRTVIKTSHTKR
jgi:hypothetical protein